MDREEGLQPVNRSSPEVKEEEVGETSRSGLPPVPPGRAEVISKGPAVLYGEVRDRKAQFRAGAARAIAPCEGGRIRTAVAREAESEADLRLAGAAIPLVFREGRAHERPHRRKPDHHAGAAPGQRGEPRGLRVLARASAPVHFARPRAGERQEGEHPVLPGEAGRRGEHQGKHEAERDGAGRAQRGAEPERRAVARNGPGTTARQSGGDAEARGYSDAVIQRAAYRRAVFEVRKARRGSQQAPRAG